MDSQVLHVMTISNSIIGVSLLAMPYCFKQCGIILSILILIASSILSRLSCHLLLKSAIIARRKTFEVLAFHAFGSLGKFMTEIGIIGFLIGTCIAFFVIMGDLGPTIVTKISGSQSTDTMRTSILMALALFCVLPLGLLRNIDSLSCVCTATIGFYFCLVVKIVCEAIPHLFSGDWISKVEFWRPSGILQCLPIFSMALSCQTQIFEIYQVVQNASLEKMNNLIRVAINICGCVYILVGTFGYIAFCNQPFTGNILMSFSSSALSDAIKIGFILSVAFSFPLVIFPCRASVYSLLFKHAYSLHEGTDRYIPEGRFKGITFIIIFIPLVIGIMIPNIELVLGIMGSTIGILICVIFPATCFICISTKNTNERILAQIMLFFGILIMVLGTYTNLITSDVRPLDIMTIERDIPKAMENPLETKKPDIKQTEIPQVIKAQHELVKDLKDDIVRHEPPQPQEPVDTNNKNPSELLTIPKVEPNNNAGDIDIQEVKSSAEVDHQSAVGNKPKNDIRENEPPKVKTNKPKQPDILLLDKIEVRHEPPQPVEPVESKIENKQPEIFANNVAVKDDNEKQAVIPEKLDPNPPTEAAKLETIPLVTDAPILINPEKQTVDIEAIKKEDKELLEQEKAELTNEEKKNLELLKTLEKQNKEQQKLVKESEKVLEEIKRRQQVLEEKKLKVLEKEKQVQLKEETVLENNKPSEEKNFTNEVIEKKQEDTIKLKMEKLVPLPIVLSKTNNGTEHNKTIQLAKTEEILIKESIADVKKIQNNENELPVLHREIRSTNNTKLEETQKVCDSKTTTTEKTMRNINVQSLNHRSVKLKAKSNAVSNIDMEMKPLTRDLKSYNISEKN